MLESLFNKNAGISPPTLLKWDSNTAIFLQNLQNFYNTLFYRTPLVAALDCLRDKFSEYPRDIILGISIIVCSIPQHFLWFKNYRLCWFLILFLAFLLLVTKESMLKSTQTYCLEKQPPEVFYEKGVLRNFKKLTGKHLYQSLFFNKVAGLRLCKNCDQLEKFIKIWRLSQDNLRTGNFRKKREDGSLLSKLEPPLQNRRAGTCDDL